MSTTNMSCDDVVNVIVSHAPQCGQALEARRTPLTTLDGSRAAANGFVLLTFTTTPKELQHHAHYPRARPQNPRQRRQNFPPSIACVDHHLRPHASQGAPPTPTAIMKPVVSAFNAWTWYEKIKRTIKTCESGKAKGLYTASSSPSSPS